MSWFSAKPGKAAAERFVLIYSPIWMALVGTVMLGGFYRGWSDPMYMGFGLLAALPLVVVPWLRPCPEERGLEPWQTSWFRMNLWVAILVGFGNYFGSAYFFDVLGMRYAFPTRWTLDAALVGRSDATVPLFMYPLTQAYFVSYHAGMLVVLRRIRRALNLDRLSPGTARWPRQLLLALATLALAYGVSFAETLFMASDAISDLFWYADKSRMLRWGSLFYACYFLVSLPLLARLDEPPGPMFSPGRAALEALAAGMLVFMILDALALLLGPLVV